MSDNDFELKLVIPIDKYQQIMAYTNLVDTEITQFADAVIEGNNTVRIGEVYLLKQEATGSHVDMEEEDVSKFMFELIKKGKTQLPNCWIHSHVNMAAFFSGTDVNTYTNTLDNGNWAVALVVNKRQEMKAVFQQYKPFKYTWEMEVEIDYAGAPILEKWKKEVERKVKEKTYKAVEVKGKKKGNIQVYEKEETSSTWWGQGQGYREPTTGNTSIQSKKPFALTLPKEREKAIARIDEYNLQREWDEEYQMYKFVNPTSALEYYDYWEVVQDYVPNKGDWMN